LGRLLALSRVGGSQYMDRTSASKHDCSLQGGSAVARRSFPVLRHSMVSRCSYCSHGAAPAFELSIPGARANLVLTNIGRRRSWEAFNGRIFVDRLVSGCCFLYWALSWSRHLQTVQTCSGMVPMLEVSDDLRTAKPICWTQGKFMLIWNCFIGKIIRYSSTSTADFEC